MTDPARARLSREVRVLALPAIVASLLQTAVFVVDRAMLGAYGEAALAAMQIVGPLEWSIYSIFTAVQVGAIARIGRHVGAGRADLAGRTALLALAIAFVAGAVVALAAPFLIAHYPDLYPRASPDVIAAARGYSRFTLAATPLLYVGAISIAALQATGDTRTPLAIGAATNLLHIALNRVLILGAFGVPALGATGAGISTTIALGGEAALATLLLFRHRDRMDLRRGYRATSPELRPLASVSIPALFERVVYHAGMLGFTALLGLLGDAAMAANQALISIESICFLTADGFGIAAAALVAQKLGAGKEGDAIVQGKVAIRDAVVVLTAFGFLATTFRDLLLPIFSSRSDVLAIGHEAMLVVAVVEPFMALGIVLGQAMRGAGLTQRVFWVTAFSAVVVRLGATWLFTSFFHFGLVGAWIGSTCDWVVRGFLFLLVARGRIVATRSTHARERGSDPEELSRPSRPYEA